MNAKPEKGNPSSAQPMPGLSKRAQALLTRPSAGKFATAIEHAGSGLARLEGHRDNARRGAQPPLPAVSHFSQGDAVNSSAKG